MRVATTALVLTTALLVAAPAASAAGGAPFCVVSNQSSNTVSLLDAAPTPPAVTKTVPVGAVPERVAVTPDGRTAVVANAGDGTVSFLDTASGTVVGAPVTVGSNPFGVAVTPDGRLAYVTNILSDSVSVIDLSTRTVRATVAVGTSPGGVAVSPDGSFAYVANFNDNTVSAIDTATQTVSRVLPAGFGPSAIAVSSDSGTLFVADVIFPRGLSVVDVAGGTVTSTLGTGLDPGDIAISPDNRFLAVADGARVLLVPTPPNPLTVIPITVDQASGVAFSSVGATVYATGSAGLTAVSVPSGATAGPVTLGLSPLGIACGVHRSVAMAAFRATAAIDVAKRAGQDRLAFAAAFTLGAASNGLDPAHEGVVVTLGSTTLRVPASGIVRTGPRTYAFAGIVDGVKVAMALRGVTATSYQLDLVATQADLRAVRNPVDVRVAIGDDDGGATITALIRRP
jgi:YVTN family beta-propeller protein